jgi:hypothetical protein
VPTNLKLFGQGSGLGSGAFRQIDKVSNIIVQVLPLTNVSFAQTDFHINWHHPSRLAFSDPLYDAIDLIWNSDEMLQIRFVALLTYAANQVKSRRCPLSMQLPGSEVPHIYRHKSVV